MQGDGGTWRGVQSGDGPLGQRSRGQSALRAFHGALRVRVRDRRRPHGRDGSARHITTINQQVWQGFAAIVMALSHRDDGEIGENAKGKCIHRHHARYARVD